MVYDIMWTLPKYNYQYNPCMNLEKRVHIHLQSASYPSISHSHPNDTQISFLWAMNGWVCIFKLISFFIFTCKQMYVPKSGLSPIQKEVKLVCHS